MVRVLAYLLLLVWNASWQSGGVAVRFDLRSYDVGPFPTNALGVADAAQKTGMRVNLPLPDCTAQPSTCSEIALLNQLDGFSLQPRIRVRFSGAVDTGTLRDGIFVIGLGDGGERTAMNEVLFDPATDTAFAKPDEVLSQGRRYALIVTNAVHGRAGVPATSDPAFTACLAETTGYCADVAQAVAAYAAQFAPQQIVAASVFTTMSATDWMEKARAAIQDSAINLHVTNSFAIADLSAITVRQQASPDNLDDLSLPMQLLNSVGRVAFGSFQSPDFLTAQQTIPAAATGVSVALPPASKDILFNVYLPSTPSPPGGYPVVIAGHGYTGNRMDFASAIASTMASRGFATIAINAVGHGGGPGGRIVLATKGGEAIEIPLGGRAVDMNGDNAYAGEEGCLIIAGPQPVGLRDCNRQTALDLMQLVRAIKAGVDATGDGVVDLDPAHIYYSGASLGAIYGTVFGAVEPDVPAAALTVGGASAVDLVRWSPSYRPFVAAALGARQPPLHNKGADFDEDYVLRSQAVKLVQVPGAVEIQEYLERLEWYQMPGDPLAFAPHLRASPLPGVPAKRVLFQYGKGDETVPNPAQTRLVIAANSRETTSFYRHDIARQIDPNLPENPHAYIAPIGTPVQMAIAIATQIQIAGFLQTGEVPDVNPLLRIVLGKDLFENAPVLTEELNFGPARPQASRGPMGPWVLRKR